MRGSDIPLKDRINQAIGEFTKGRASMHIPAEATDCDLVLGDCLRDIESKEQRIAALEVAVSKERERCIAIVNAARSCEIDSDLRCIRNWIESGDATPGQLA